jgi:hypothetical protein
MHSHRLATAVLLTALAASSASADVFIDGKPGSYTSLQAAVDAAEDGDTLLIEHGQYATTRIVGKGLHLHGLAGSPLTLVRIVGMLEVRNLPAASVFTLSDVVVDWFNANPPQSEVDALWLKDCAGQVRVQRCTLLGSVNKQDFQNVWSGAGLRVESCPKVAVSASQLRGGDVGVMPGTGAKPGGDGLLAIDSAIALYDCEVVGGNGSDDTQPGGGKGGAGARVTGWGILLSNTTVTGGSGGSGDFVGCTKSGDGGTGLLATATQVQTIECTPKGGPHGFWGSCGNGKVGKDVELFDASTVDVPPPARSLAGPRSIDDGSTLTVSVEGAPGDQVWILRGRAPTFQPTGGPLGIVLVPKLWVLPAAPMGLIPAAGTLDVDLWMADLVGPLPSLMIYAQALMVGANGDVRLSGPLHVLVRNT